MESRFRNANSQIHKGWPRVDWMHQGNTFLNPGQPLPTGLEGLKTISRKEKVLQWLEANVCSESETLAKDNEGWENNIDEELPHEMLEEDFTCPEPSKMSEDRSQSQEYPDMSEEYSNQELFQLEEDEGTATAGGDIRGGYLQSTAPARAGPMNTKDEPATSPSQVSPQRGQAGSTTPTSTGYGLSTSSREGPSVPGVQAGTRLLPTQPLGDRSPSHIHALVQQPRQSLFRRVIRAVRKAFFGTPSPQEQEQQCAAPSTRQVPGDGHSEPRQRPVRE